MQKDNKYSQPDDEIEEKENQSSSSLKERQAKARENANRKAMVRKDL